MRYRSKGKSGSREREREAECGAEHYLIIIIGMIIIMHVG